MGFVYSKSIAEHSLPLSNIDFQSLLLMYILFVVIAGVEFDPRDSIMPFLPKLSMIAEMGLTSKTSVVSRRTRHSAAGTSLHITAGIMLPTLLPLLLLSCYWLTAHISLYNTPCSTSI